MRLSDAKPGERVKTDFHAVTCGFVIGTVIGTNANGLYMFRPEGAEALELARSYRDNRGDWFQFADDQCEIMCEAAGLFT